MRPGEPSGGMLRFAAGEVVRPGILAAGILVAKILAACAVSQQAIGCGEQRSRDGNGADENDAENDATK
jgi:hypothetical protein